MPHGPAGRCTLTPTVSLPHSAPERAPLCQPMALGAQKNARGRWISQISLSRLLLELPSQLKKVWQHQPFWPPQLSPPLRPPIPTLTTESEHPEPCCGQTASVLFWRQLVTLGIFRAVRLKPGPWVRQSCKEIWWTLDRDVQTSSYGPGLRALSQLGKTLHHRWFPGPSNPHPTPSYSLEWRPSKSSSSNTQHRPSEGIMAQFIRGISD